MKSGIMENKGTLILTGDVGTGKTTLVNALLNSLDKNVLVASITDPGLKRIDFYNFIASAFGMGKQFQDRGDFLVAFIHFLHKIFHQKKKALLIIDEAQRLSHKLLEEIRQFANIERNNRKLLNIFLVGQNELNDELMDERNKALKESVQVYHSIDPLKKNEVGEYIQFRLAVAGVDKPLFTPSAIRSIVDYSQCYPRVINTICDRALLTGFLREKKQVDAALIRECARELPIKEEWKDSIRSGVLHRRISMWPAGGRKGRLMLPLSVAAILIALLLAAFGYHHFHPFSTRASSDDLKIQQGERRDMSNVMSSGSIEEEILESPHAVEFDALASIGPEERDGREKRLAHLPIGGRYLLNFLFNSNELTNDGHETLNRIVAAAAANPDIEIRIKGYTDSEGHEDYNRQLSMYRANMVKGYLVGRGIASARMSTLGMGSQNPIASNATEAGRNANRRVEIEFLHTAPDR